MKKILLLLLLIPVYSFGQTVQEVPQQVAGVMLLGGGSSSATTSIDPCVAAGCTGTYKFCWTGDYTGPDTDKACLNSGVSQLDGTLSVATVGACPGGRSGNCFFTTALNSYLLWTSTADVLWADSQGTVFMDVFMGESSSTDALYEVYADSNNAADLYFSSSTNAHRAGWTGNGGAQTLNATANTLPDNASCIGSGDPFACCTGSGTGTCYWVRVGYSWQTGADAGGKHSWNVNGGSWTEEVEDLDDWATQPTKFCLGENQMSRASLDDTYIDNVVVLSGYQDTDPL